jgi:uncharacterized membrane protein YdjX (TVP38/TMEM64 family)
MSDAGTKQKAKFFIFLAAIILIWYAGKYLRIDIGPIQEFLSKMPVLYSGIAYVVLYVIVTFFIFFSKDLFWLLGALLFGAYPSALLVYSAEIINAALLFHLARSLGRNFVENYSKDKVKTKKIYEKLAHINFFWLCMMRFVPLIPYRFLDLGFGLTKISFRKYLIAVILGSPVKILWIQYILAGVGKSIFSTPDVFAEYLLHNKTLLIFSFWYVVLVIPLAIKLRQKY